MENRDLVARRKLQGIPVGFVTLQLSPVNVILLGGVQVTFPKRPAPRNDVKYSRRAPVPKRTSPMTFLTVQSRLPRISSETLRREIALLNDGECTKGAVNATYLSKAVSSNFVLKLDLSLNKINRQLL